MDLTCWISYCFSTFIFDSKLSYNLYNFPCHKNYVTATVRRFFKSSTRNRKRKFLCTTLHACVKRPTIVISRYGFRFRRLDRAEQAETRRINPVSPATPPSTVTDEWNSGWPTLFRVNPPPRRPHSLFAASPPPFLSTSFSLFPPPPSGRSFQSAALLWRNHAPFWRHDPRCINLSTGTTSSFLSFFSSFFSLRSSTLR